MGLDNSRRDLVSVKKHSASTDCFKNGYTIDTDNPAPLVLEDRSGYNQPYHPSVIYLENGFAGYKYWMVQSPFPTGGLPYRDRWECPVVYKSNNGVEWITVANPLDDLTEAEILSCDFMSDPHILYREDLEQIEVWYRISRNIFGFPTKILRRTTTDGVTWTEREEMIGEVFSSDVTIFRSPSYLWDNVNKKYRVWYSNGSGEYYNESRDGKTWGKQIQLTFSTPPYTWHMCVNYFGGLYHLLSFCISPNSVSHYTSTDGLTFTYDSKILSTAEGNSMYSQSLYRSCSLLDEFGKVRVYATAENSSNIATIIMLTGTGFDDLAITNNTVTHKISHSPKIKK